MNSTVIPEWFATSPKSPLVPTDTFTDFLRGWSMCVFIPRELQNLFLANAHHKDVGAHVLISFDR